GSDFPRSGSNVNEADLLQAFGELFFEDAFGEGRPLRFQAGRLSIDYVDRRLRSRNGFRNTTNSFDGFRVQIGSRESDWEIDAFAVQPVARNPNRFDHPDEERWFYGVAGAWRRWSSIITLEPYYFVLDEDRSRQRDVELHTFGLRGYGPIGQSGFDYDFDAALQYGRNQGLNHRAYAAHAELGYTFERPWDPRLAAWINYASGDRQPNDSVSGRFNPLFGSSHGMYGFSDMFNWQNIINPAMGVQFQPTDQTRCAVIYRGYWLASKKDGFVRGGRIDPRGDSGRFIGQELDLLVLHQLTDCFSIELGYAHFIAGTFVRSTGPSPDTDMFYVQTTLRF
ncbi:MAG: alginate export family protein, partial [Phycisphaerae bacterium]